MTGTCSEPGIECDDDDGTGGLSLIQRTNVPAGVYVVAVDAYSSSATFGPIKVNVAGTIAPGGSCDGLLAQSGAFTCTTGYVCQGPVGARVCGSQCNDGVDNNGDGKTDYPDDPGCAEASDNSEDTVYPGATCPVCSDGADNDGDGATDFPADTSCEAASGPSELCAGEDDPVLRCWWPRSACRATSRGA